MFTWKDLAKILSNMQEAEKQNQITVYDSYEQKWFPLRHARKTKNDEEGNEVDLEKGQTYLVF